MSRRKYSKKFKLKVLAEHEEKGLSFWKLGKNYGIDASIIRRWWHAFDAYGEKGLEKYNSDLCKLTVPVTRYLQISIGSNYIQIPIYFLRS